MNVILIKGGNRSGKSTKAREIVAGLTGSVWLLDEPHFLVKDGLLHLCDYVGGATVVVTWNEFPGNELRICPEPSRVIDLNDPRTREIA